MNLAYGFYCVLIMTPSFLLPYLKLFLTKICHFSLIHFLLRLYFLTMIFLFHQLYQCGLTFNSLGCNPELPYLNICSFTYYSHCCSFGSWVLLRFPLSHPLPPSHLYLMHLSFFIRCFRLVLCFLPVPALEITIISKSYQEEFGRRKG